MKLAVTIGLFVLMLAFASTSHAQGLGNARPAKQQTNQLVKPLSATNSANARTTATGNLAQRTISEIDRQITILQELASKVDSLTHLTPTERSTLSTQIQTEITNLQTLKTRISGNSEETNVKTNIKSVLDSHKKFSFFMPQIRLLIAAESMDAIANRMLAAAQKIETRLDSMESENTAEITTLLENMKAKLNNAKAQSNAIIAAVSPLESTNFPANKTTLQSAQAKLKSGMADIRSALKDLKEILQMLKEMGSAENITPTSSITPIESN
ncbi:MAG: hypothetical protein KA035_02070 [Candidatus Levybacteria bacterium]|nr:hypothetical protein [Candidatus Levybacteria bacterium]